MVIAWLHDRLSECEEDLGNKGLAKQGLAPNYEVGSLSLDLIACLDPLRDPTGGRAPSTWGKRRQVGTNAVLEESLEMAKV